MKDLTATLGVHPVAEPTPLPASPPGRLLSVGMFAFIGPYGLGVILLYCAADVLRSSPICLGIVIGAGIHKGFQEFVKWHDRHAVAPQPMENGK